MARARPAPPAARPWRTSRPAAAAAGRFPGPRARAARAGRAGGRSAPRTDGRARIRSRSAAAPTRSRRARLRRGGPRGCRSAQLVLLFRLTRYGAPRWTAAADHPRHELERPRVDAAQPGPRRSPRRPRAAGRSECAESLARFGDGRCVAGHALRVSTASTLGSGEGTGSTTRPRGARRSRSPRAPASGPRRAAPRRRRSPARGPGPGPRSASGSRRRRSRAPHRRGEARGRELELARLGEHGAEKRAQRRVGALAGVVRDARLAADAQVGVHAAEPLERPARGGICRQHAEHPEPLADEVGGQRPVAVQGGVGPR